MVKPPKFGPKESVREQKEAQSTFAFTHEGGFKLPELGMLAKSKPRAAQFDEGALRQNAQLLESVLAEFGVRGQVDQIRPGPVVTLYELVPAAGVKSARVVALADDIARSMSVASARVSVVPGRNAIGIELPNQRARPSTCATCWPPGIRARRPEPAHGAGRDHRRRALHRRPGQDAPPADRRHHRLGQVGGRQRHDPVDPLPPAARAVPDDHDRPEDAGAVVYDGIPHLLAPVVTDPKKAIVALKWTVREMEDRYRRMSKIGVRNVGLVQRARPRGARQGRALRATVQTGFDDAAGRSTRARRSAPSRCPTWSVIIDEVADLMMVAGKDIEGAVQRLAQMARAAGIHLIMATQRPSVDVITGTIKANFPTRISFQVTSKIDSRTILGEQGAEQLLGQGDMLYMAGGGPHHPPARPVRQRRRGRGGGQVPARPGHAQLPRGGHRRRRRGRRGRRPGPGRRRGEQRPLRPRGRRGHPRRQGLDQTTSPRRRCQIATTPRPPSLIERMGAGGASSARLNQRRAKRGDISSERARPAG
jgi:S-DNA-T family DNA segregation ATPase FtsK/SpoIIIE